MTDAMYGPEQEGFESAAPLLTPLVGYHPDALYRAVEFDDPNTSMFIARHYGGGSHIMTDEAVAWVQAVGRGIDNPHRQQYAVFVSPDDPSQAVIYERIEP